MIRGSDDIAVFVVLVIFMLAGMVVLVVVLVLALSVMVLGLIVRETSNANTAQSVVLQCSYICGLRRVRLFSGFQDGLDKSFGFGLGVVAHGV